MATRPPGLHRQLLLLELLAAAPQGFSQLRRSLAPLPASTLVRDLRALAACNLVREGGAGYAIAPGATALARRLLGRPAADAAAQVAVTALAGETGESAAYFVHEVDRMVLVAKHEVPEGYHYIDVHAHRWLLDSVFGIAVVAALPEAERRALLAAGLGRLEAAERALVPAQVRRSARDGWLVREEPGRRWRLVAPVVRGGRAVGATGISRFGAPSGERLARLLLCVRAAARRMSD